MLRPTVSDSRIVSVLLVAAAGPAMASSDDAWAAFRAEVEARCTALAAAPKEAEVAVEVSPFGSESYGAALVTVTTKDGAERMICVTDKASGKAEITTPLPEAD